MARVLSGEVSGGVVTIFTLSKHKANTTELHPEGKLVTIPIEASDLVVNDLRKQG